MTLRKKALFFGMMVVMLFIIFEVTAWGSYYITYDEFHSLDEPGDGETTRDAKGNVITTNRQILHPYYGFTHSSPNHALNIFPPPQRREGALIVGLTGGSVADQVTSHFQEILERHIVAKELALTPQVYNLALNAYKQPQQLAVLTNFLANGGEFDIFINLDGFNEVAESAQMHQAHGLNPAFPWFWLYITRRSDAQVALTGRILALRDEQRILSSSTRSFPLRLSGVYRLITRLRLERLESQILRLNADLLNSISQSAEYSLETQGPLAEYANDAELHQALARL